MGKILKMVISVYLFSLGMVTQSIAFTQPEVPVLMVVQDLVKIDHEPDQDSAVTETAAAVVNSTDKISIEFSTYLYDPFLPHGQGRKIDSSENMKIDLKTTTLIQGWRQGLTGLRKGSRRTLIVPPKLAYGDKGIRNLIPPHSPLLIHIKCLDINK